MLVDLDFANSVGVDIFRATGMISVAGATEYRKPLDPKVSPCHGGSCGFESRLSRSLVVKLSCFDEFVGSTIVLVLTNF